MKFIRKRVIIMASKTKKAAAFIMASALAATALAGCGGSSSTPAGPGNVSVAQTSFETSVINLKDDEVMKYIKDTMASEAKDGKIVLKLWCSGDDMAFEKERLEAFKTLVADSRYEIKIGVVENGEDKAGQKVIENPKKAADVFSFADDQLSGLQKAGAIAAVAPYYEGNVRKEHTDDSLAVSTVGDELLAYPKTSDNGYFLYYDKRVFTDESVLDNMDEMIKVANAANKHVYLNVGNAWYNTGFFFTAGCTIKYENGKQTAEIANAKGLSAAKAMCHIAESQDKGFKGSPGQIGDNAYVTQGFEEGFLAAAVIGTWEGPAIKKAIGDENVGAAKLPKVLMDGEYKQLDSFGGYKLIGVGIYSEYPFSAQTLAYFLSSKESQEARYNTRGLLPTNKELGEDPAIKKDPAFKALEDQKPYSHAQGTSVGSVYWGSGIADVGGKAVSDYGKRSDDVIMEQLKGVEANMKA